MVRFFYSMSEQIRALWQWVQKPGMTAGRVALVTVLAGALISVTTFWGYFQFTPHANAANVSTSLTVLNTPPTWTVNPAEAGAGYATSTPLNAGSTLSFTATGSSSSGNNYWLIICSIAGGATPHVSAPPTCNSGIQWAISATTTSGSVATASTSTIATAPFNNESNNWYAYICDGDLNDPLCATSYQQGSGNTGSPFVIDHPPVFSAISNNSPQNPGASITWNATATTTDVIRGGDTLQLFVCKSAAFVASSSTCTGGEWANSSLVTINPSTSTVLTIPFQDNTYNAYVYVMNQFGLVATSTFEGSASNFVVNHVAPTISQSGITVGPTSTAIILTSPHAINGPFKVSFVVTDNNGCQNHLAGNEISAASTSIYLSSVGSNSCQLSTDYNSNSCYPSTSPYAQVSCAYDSTVNACTGTSDSDEGWTCTFYMWYNADPTDTGSKYVGQSWQAYVQAESYMGDYSAGATSTSGSNNVNTLLAYNVATSSIGYGGLTPGGNTGTLSQTTDLQEWGNSGIDEDLYGDTMCTTWSAPDSCDAGGPDATRRIPVSNQQFASSSLSYGSGTALTSSTSPALFGIHVQKTTATSSVNDKNTYWGIQVPGTITVSGSYRGQDTITAVESSTTNW